MLCANHEALDANVSGTERACFGHRRPITSPVNNSRKLSGHGHILWPRVTGFIPDGGNHGRRPVTIEPDGCVYVCNGIDTGQQPGNNDTSTRSGGMIQRRRLG